jgi:hypothetical protein
LLEPRRLDTDEIAVKALQACLDPVDERDERARQGDLPYWLKIRGDVLPATPPLTPQSGPGL